MKDPRPTGMIPELSMGYGTVFITTTEKPEPVFLGTVHEIDLPVISDWGRRDTLTFNNPTVMDLTFTVSYVDPFLYLYGAHEWRPSTEEFNKIWRRIINRMPERKRTKYIIKRYVLRK